MEYVYASILVLLATIGLVLVPFGLPGTWLMALSTALLAWWTWDEPLLSLTSVIVVCGLAAVGEIIDFFAAMAGSKKAGGSGWGSWGGVLGGILGAIFGTPLIPIPILGTILGGCLGAFLGATLFECVGGKEVQPAMRSGGGAAVGRFFGTVAKLVVGCIMWVWIATAAFWP